MISIFGFGKLLLFLEIIFYQNRNYAKLALLVISHPSISFSTEVDTPCSQKFLVEYFFNGDGDMCDIYAYTAV